MSWELPSALQQVHSLVAADAPWPRSDETSRLDGAGSFLDLASASQGGRSQADSAVAHVRTAGNTGDDMYVFENSYGVEAERMDDAFVANALVGTGTTALVVLRTVWKFVVVLSLIALLVALIQGFRLGPVLGALFARSRVMGTRQALRTALGQVERNIQTGAVASLQVAKRLLARAMIVPGMQTALVAVNALTLDPFVHNPEAQKDAERVLEQTAEGREALAYAKEHGITTLYQGEMNLAWSDYNRGLNVIRIGSADTAGAEALAGEFVRQVHMAKDRWEPSSGDIGEYMRERGAEEDAANQAAYRMGSQLGHEQAARHTYLEGGHGAGYQKLYEEHNDRLAQAILNGPFALFNRLDFT
ncbi:hypothetical protein [Nonomuraea basaltis]|uniref:hypothetical protein n=1 Tax=Nonomuraea basaltis TaxID=2495887 RepID=UPI00110C652D|nr:hypothetical protein [Nonomuraea basaltis]TMR96946.1 hypothetical protein EJK15_20410 [Nonomuraea basaltis]